MKIIIRILSWMLLLQGIMAMEETDFLSAQKLLKANAALKYFVNQEAPEITAKQKLEIQEFLQSQPKKKATIKIVLGFWEIMENSKAADEDRLYATEILRILPKVNLVMELFPEGFRTQYKRAALGTCHRIAINPKAKPEHRIAAVKFSLSHAKKDKQDELIGVLHDIALGPQATVNNQIDAFNLILQ